MDKEINIEEFKIRWKDFLASNLYGDLSKEIRSLLTHIIKELENHIEDKAKKIVDLEDKVKRLVEEVERMTLDDMTIKEIDPVAELNRLALELQKANLKTKELVDGIEKHRKKHSEHGWWQSVDEELYKLIEKERP